MCSHWTSVPTDIYSIPPAPLCIQISITTFYQGKVPPVNPPYQTKFLIRPELQTKPNQQRLNNGLISMYSTWLCYWIKYKNPKTSSMDIGLKCQGYSRQTATIFCWSAYATKTWNDKKKSSDTNKQVYEPAK